MMDIEVVSIESEPTVRESFEDELLLREIWCLSKEGERLCEGGFPGEAQVQYERAFRHIQSSRCKEIKNHLYSKSSRGARSGPLAYK